MDPLCVFCLVFAMSLCVSVYMCFVVTCWERADPLALVCGLSPSHWTPGSGVVLDCIVPDLCTLTYFGILQWILLFLIILNWIFTPKQ